MLYDLPTNASEYQAPVQSSVILRSQASENGNPFHRPQLNQPGQILLRQPNISAATAEKPAATSASTAAPVAAKAAEVKPTPAKSEESKPQLNVRSGVDIDKFSRFLSNITRQTSTHKCARSIRIGLQSSGAKIVNHPVAAADWGNTLLKIGYRKIDLSFDQPKKGDIYIIDRNSSSKYGHIAAYSGSAWVSDYKQRSHAVYRNPNVHYTYYRLGGK